MIRSATLAERDNSRKIGFEGKNSTIELPVGLNGCDLILLLPIIEKCEIFEIVLEIGLAV